MRSAAPDPPTIGIALQRRYRASPERLFRALTEPTALREWWCPPGWVAGAVEIDLRVGGEYRIEMRRRGSPAAIAVSGRFVEVRPPERLVYTWRWEGAFPEMPETLVIVDIRGTAHDTLVSLQHLNFADQGIRHQHHSGWIAACERLDELVTECPAVRPQQAAG